MILMSQYPALINIKGKRVNDRSFSVIGTCISFPLTNKAESTVSAICMDSDLGYLRRATRGKGLIDKAIHEVQNSGRKVIGKALGLSYHPSLVGRKDLRM
ncbi:hypothetical protein NPIL_533801 [Nephila pilipes]|uniref:Uncharacterized protein n=1 Tax=Nephila pilipes TaxID=299642 RepID=A0A8X6U050_NEPPI|nr:hypothetical protein NPIL_533801 [Nephila pilipes]